MANNSMVSGLGETARFHPCTIESSFPEVGLALDQESRQGYTITYEEEMTQREIRGTPIAFSTLLAYK